MPGNNYAADDADALARLIHRRRSIRRFENTAIAADDLRVLVSCAGGGVGPAVPSAHALYPLRIDVVVYSVDGLAPGHFRLQQNDDGGLSHLGDPPPESELLDACLDKPAWTNASAVIAVSAGDEPVRHFAGQAGDPYRGHRFVHVEAGHAAQNVQLMATALGLGTVLIGGIVDDRVADTLALPRGVRPIALLPVGVPS